jgi:NAD(P)-dependent dehydrogenase (short-subunit alcohol dehydrogenase family)
VLERLLATAGSRIVTVSSRGHVEGIMQFDDLHFARGYRASPAYWQSKLANLLFTYELQAALTQPARPRLPSPRIQASFVPTCGERPRSSSGR